MNTRSLTAEQEQVISEGLEAGKSHSVIANEAQCSPITVMRRARKSRYAAGASATTLTTYTPDQVETDLEWLENRHPGIFEDIKNGYVRKITKFKHLKGTQ